VGKARAWPLVLLVTGCNAVWNIESTELANDNPRVLILDNTASDATLVDVPVMVVLDASRIHYEEVTDPTTQLRFVDDTDTELAHEIEHWDASGRSYVWVHVPTIPARTTPTLRMYYGINAGTLERPSEVWPSYDVVFHAIPDRLASSVGDLSGTATGISGGSGVVSDAVRFNTSTSMLRFANSATVLTGVDAFTIEMWLYADYAEASSPTTERAVFRNGSSIPDGYLERTAAQVADPLLFTLELFFNDSGTFPSRYSTIVPLQRWVYLVYTTDGEQFWTYSDGAFVDADLTTPPRRLIASTPTTALQLGDTQSAFSGMIDELRVSRTYRDAAWINAQYRSMTGKLVRFVAPGAK
jgi:hypothetical protein